MRPQKGTCFIESRKFRPNMFLSPLDTFEFIQQLTIFNLNNELWRYVRNNGAVVFRTWFQKSGISSSKGSVVVWICLAQGATWLGGVTLLEEEVFLGESVSLWGWLWDLTPSCLRTVCYWLHIDEDIELLAPPAYVCLYTAMFSTLMLIDKSSESVSQHH